MRVIDLSNNNWQEIKDIEIEFVMVACLYGKIGQHDRFLENVNGAHTVV